MLRHRLRDSRNTREIGDRLRAEGLPAARLVRFDQPSRCRREADSESSGEQEREDDSPIDVPAKRELAERLPKLPKHVPGHGSGHLAADGWRARPRRLVEDLRYLVVARLVNNRTVRAEIGTACDRNQA